MLNKNWLPNEIYENPKKKLSKIPLVCYFAKIARNKFDQSKKNW
jgi:hypothetical protein